MAWPKWDPNRRFHWLRGDESDSPGSDEHRAASQLLLESRSTVVLTGAGISTPSGIPDFRSPGSGLWEFVDPADVASIWGFRADPARFYRWIRPLAAKMQAAQPNPAHRALAQLEELGLVHTIVTQNIDDLHTQAGSRRVLHLHGQTQQAVCLECGQSQPAQELWQSLLQGQESVPRCPACGGLVKPDVVLFGEALPPALLAEAQQAVLRCDLMVVAGSSLEVMPAADLPLLAKRRGARLLILNLGHTLADSRADLVIREDLAVSLPAIAALCAQALGQEE